MTTKKEIFYENGELYNNLSEDVKKKLAECRTPDEIRKVLAEAGVEPLDDKLLSAASGGMRDPVFHIYDIYEQSARHRH